MLTVDDEPASTPSCGNIFADLDLPDPELLLAKAKLCAKISRIVRERKLTQKQAATLMGLTQPNVSDLLRGRLDGFTLDRLFRCLDALGQEIESVVLLFQPNAISKIDMVDYEADFYCKLSRYRKGMSLWSGRATWKPTGVRAPGGLRRGKLVWGRRPHPAYYHGRRVHVAYYCKSIVRRPTPYGKLVWSERYPSSLHTTVGRWSVSTFGALDPLGTWTWGGLYDYQVPYVETMWIKWVRKREREAANANTVAQ